MVIKLTADYRGVLTGETYYTAGTYAVPGEMLEAHAAALVAAGRAVEEVKKVAAVKRSTRRRTVKK